MTCLPGERKFYKIAGLDICMSIHRINSPEPYILEKASGVFMDNFDFNKFSFLSWALIRADIKIFTSFLKLVTNQAIKLYKVSVLNLY
jgi:hypothetical protein